ncbi:dephospho-CoA kinase [Latilactobacillus sakei]
MTYFLGLTGGIATGKTTVSQMLAQQGIPIIDGDQVAHQVLANNQSVQAQIQATFGKQACTRWSGRSGSFGQIGLW